MSHVGMETAQPQRFPLRNAFRYVKLRYVRHGGVLRCIMLVRYGARVTLRRGRRCASNIVWVGCVSRSKANFTASESLLLAPPNDNSISRKHNIIKEAVFQYISDTKRML